MVPKKTVRIKLCQEKLLRSNGAEMAIEKLIWAATSDLAPEAKLGAVNRIGSTPFYYLQCNPSCTLQSSLL